MMWTTLVAARRGLTLRLTRAGKRRASDAAASRAAGCYAVTSSRLFNVAQVLDETPTSCRR
jgi:hypothetical protein